MPHSSGRMHPHWICASDGNAPPFPIQKAKTSFTHVAMEPMPAVIGSYSPMKIRMDEDESPGKTRLSPHTAPQKKYHPLFG